jgi:hypothetical protein
MPVPQHHPPLPLTHSVFGCPLASFVGLRRFPYESFGFFVSESTDLLEVLSRV